MDDAEIPFKIAVARRILAREGCESTVAGHVSVRAPGEDALWISSYQYFDETVPERVVKLGFDLQQQSGDLPVVSPELSNGGDDDIPIVGAVAFHARLFERLPQINAIVHTHSHYAMVLATTGKLLGMYNDECAKFLDDQVIHYDDGTGKPVPGDVLADEVGDKHVIILKNHGAIFLAESLEVATVDAFAFEHCARIQVDAMAIGGGEHTRAYAERAKPPYRDKVWPHLWYSGVRRLRIADPEFFATYDRELAATR